MRETFLTDFEGFPFFTFEGICQRYGEEAYAPGTITMKLHRWINNGKIIKLKRGVYMHETFYQRHKDEADFSIVVSSIIEPLSYVSMEFVLQRKGVLTEITYPVTSVTCKNTKNVENQVGSFQYRHIKAPLFSNYSVRESMGVSISEASPAKALFDFLYFRSLPKQITNLTFDLAASLRLDLDDFSHSEREEFIRISVVSGVRKCIAAADNIRRNAWQD